MTGSSLCFSASVVILRVHKVGSLNDHPTRMGDRKEKDPQGWEKWVFERPRSFLFQVSPPPWVLHAYAVRTTGMPPARQRGSFSTFTSTSTGALRLLFTFVCLGAHKVRYRPPRGRCSLSWTVTGSKSSGRPVAFERCNPTQPGLQPEDWKGQRPNQPKDPAKRQVS